MFLGFLKILFYLAIAIPFLYMLFDVLFQLLTGIYQIYKNKAKPVFVQISTSLLKL